jgi:hypothetical protein
MSGLPVPGVAKIVPPVWVFWSDGSDEHALVRVDQDSQLPPLTGIRDVFTLSKLKARDYDRHCGVIEDENLLVNTVIGSFGVRDYRLRRGAMYARWRVAVAQAAAA